jgi:hypothetical protein
VEAAHIHRVAQVGLETHHLHPQVKVIMVVQQSQLTMAVAVAVERLLLADQLPLWLLGALVVLVQPQALVVRQ